MLDDVLLYVLRGPCATWPIPGLAHPPGAQRAATGGGGTPIDAVTGHDDVLLYVNLLCGGVRIPSTAALHPLVGPVPAYKMLEVC